MVIEFIGSPGAGKTTLLPTVIEFLSEHGIHARTVVNAARPCAQRTWVGRFVARLAPPGLQQPLLWQVFYHLSTGYRVLFWLAHPRLIFQVLRSQLQRPVSWEERYHALHWFFHLIGYYQFLQTHARADEALVLDEGFVHRVVQMNASDKEEPDLDRIFAYVALLPQPDLVIAIHAPWEVCFERIYRRGIWDRFRHKSRDDVARYVANAHDVVSVTIEHMRKSGWPLIDVENGRDDAVPPAEDLHRKLAEWAFTRRVDPVPAQENAHGWIGG